jgi:hypothetical protein
MPNVDYEISRRQTALRRIAIGMVIMMSAWRAHADENLLGYTRSAETLPAGAAEMYQTFTHRADKGAGTYRALDSSTEFEYGITDRLTGTVGLKAQAIDTEDLLIDAYIPKDERYGLRVSGVEALLKYNFLKPALDPLGLSATFGFEHSWLDPHSGQDKDTYSFETGLQAQKFFREDQLVWLTNVAIEATIAKRAGIDDLPPGFEWPTEEEMEIEFTGATGLSYRFARNWFVGGEVLYQIERETEVGIERWSVQAGPSLHYGGRRWWATLTWLPQWVGGGERFAAQDDGNLHLIEKTKQEGRLRVGYNF